MHRCAFKGGHVVVTPKVGKGLSDSLVQVLFSGEKRLCFFFVKMTDTWTWQRCNSESAAVQPQTHNF